MSRETPKKTPAKRRGNPATLRTPWKPGESGNPKGRPSLAEIEKRAREASRKEISEYYQEMKDLSVNELKSISRDNSTKSLKAWFASSMIKGIERGDLSELHRMYDRILGKPKQQLEHTGKDNGPIQISALELLKQSIDETEKNYQADTQSDS